MKDCWRHGDVILVPKKIPSDAKEQPKDDGKVVLAYGEVTGHMHQISKGNAALFKFNDKTYLKIQSDMGLLSHEEHHEINVPCGEYEIIIQKDYSPEGWKKVTD